MCLGNEKKKERKKSEKTVENMFSIEFSRMQPNT